MSPDGTGGLTGAFGDLSFNEHLDADGDVEILGYRFSRSRILYILDELAYNDALIEWRSQRVEEWFELVVTLAGIGENRKRLEALSQAAVNGSLVPFVGAGVTVDCGMRAWTPFLVGLAKAAGFDDSDTSARIGRGEYEEVAEDITSKMGWPWFNERVHLEFGQQSRIVGPLCHLPRLIDGCVITTNFDNSLERVFQEAGKHFETVYLGRLQVGFGIALATGRRCLLKLHGSATFPATRVLTRTEYLAAYGEHGIDYARELPHSLKKAFEAAQLLFIGCSLGQDRTLELFKDVLAKGRADDIPRHYAILAQPTDTSEIPARERFLADRHIFPIWFPHGEFKYIEAILAWLTEVATGGLDPSRTLRNAFENTAPPAKKKASAKRVSAAKKPSVKKKKALVAKRRPTAS